MSWHVSGQFIEACSCKLLCPCWFGPAEPDRGWCSAVLAYDVKEGNANGVRLDGRRIIWAMEFPKDFTGGNGTARLYIDDDATHEQRRELEAIWTGKYGGPWAAASALITKWLPTSVASIVVERGDHPSVKVGNVGVVKTQRFIGEDGRPTRVMNAPIHQAFQV